MLEKNWTLLPSTFTIIMKCGNVTNCEVRSCEIYINGYTCFCWLNDYFLFYHLWQPIQWITCQKNLFLYIYVTFTYVFILFNDVIQTTNRPDIFNCTFPNGPFMCLNLYSPRLNMSNNCYLTKTCHVDKKKSSIFRHKGYNIQWWINRHQIDKQGICQWDTDDSPALI